MKKAGGGGNVVAEADVGQVTESLIALGKHLSFYSKCMGSYGRVGIRRVIR